MGTPDAGSYWRILEAEKVNCMFTAPTALRAVRREDPDGAFIDKYDTSSLRYDHAMSPWPAPRCVLVFVADVSLNHVIETSL